MNKAVIDQFVIPKKSEKEFFERGSITRELIEKQPGLVEMSSFIRDDGDNLRFLTVAVWEDQESVEKAGNAIFSSFQKQGFDGKAFFERLDVVLQREVYDVGYKK